MGRTGFLDCAFRRRLPLFCGAPAHASAAGLRAYRCLGAASVSGQCLSCICLVFKHIVRIGTLALRTHCPRLFNRAHRNSVGDPPLGLPSLKRPCPIFIGHSGLFSHARRQASAPRLACSSAGSFGSRHYRLLQIRPLERPVLRRALHRIRRGVGPGMRAVDQPIPYSAAAAFPISQAFVSSLMENLAICLISRSHA